MYNNYVVKNEILQKCVKDRKMLKSICKYGISVLLFLIVFVSINLNCVYAQDDKSDFVYDTDLWYDVDVAEYGKVGSMEYIVKNIVDKDLHTVYFYIDCISDTPEPVVFDFSLDISNGKNKYENIILEKNMKHEDFDFTLNIQNTVSKNGKPSVFAVKFKNKTDFLLDNTISISFCSNKNTFLIYSNTYSVSDEKVTTTRETTKRESKTTKNQNDKYNKDEKPTKFYSKNKKYYSYNKDFNMSSKYYNNANGSASSYGQNDGELYGSLGAENSVLSEDGNMTTSKLPLGSKILVGVGTALVIASFAFVFWGIAKNKKDGIGENEEEDESEEKD